MNVFIINLSVVYIETFLRRLSSQDGLPALFSFSGLIQWSFKCNIIPFSTLNLCPQNVWLPSEEEDVKIEVNF